MQLRSRMTLKTAIIAIMAATSPFLARRGTVMAQMPDTPILQNAWATPGIVGAVNIGGGSDGTVYAAAASWTPGSGRFQLSGGGGLRTRTGASAGGVYGARVAMPFGRASSNFGFGAFAGVGGGASGKADDGYADSSASTMEIPIGASVGWRHTIATTHGISVYATPSYVFYTGGDKSDGLIRVGLGVDVGITRAIGATAGAEFGGNRPRGLGGPTGALFGVGLSYALGH